LIDHELKFETKGTFTSKIDHELDQLKAKMTPLDLTSQINEKFDTKFQIYQIKYRIDKLYQASFGKLKTHFNLLTYPGLNQTKEVILLLIKTKTIA